MPQIVAVINQKGGVGKTTTCLSLGACLAEMGRPTLVVDMDSQANLSVAAGYKDGEELTLPDAMDAQIQAQPIEWQKLVQPTAVDGLSILLADERLAALERRLYDQADYELLLGSVLKMCPDGYEFILLDCPPALGAISIMALSAANRALVPVQCEYLAAIGLMRLLETIEAVREHTNPQLEYDLLAVMFDKRNKINREVLERLRDNFSERLLDTVISVDTHLRECVIAGEPITLYKPNTRATEQYRQLAQEYTARLLVPKR